VAAPEQERLAEQRGRLLDIVDSELSKLHRRSVGDSEPFGNSERQALEALARTLRLLERSLGTPDEGRAGGLWTADAIEAALDGREKDVSMVQSASSL
jgi:hypothetical protein